ncbi:FtsQ-type POTRA domain-containing protein [Fusibacter paucivorans]|uniref:FtsQ-type POTRA domain-containing protein n=1 Tax=Fusibacter paucivorans TaxID=76009 RepID=A0ABS5PQX8_9FIRM|nr:FtsQ-type POTRA domain-containing protein [Fusibacter paucivorans]MBS7527540.1 FtsQ-type POTRA domain-containing protein [Fusibacter paucivorans]
MKVLKRLLLFLILACLLGGAYYIVFETDWLKVRTINYNPNDALDIYELQRYSGIHYGDSMFTLDLAHSEATLMTHPYIRTAKITRTFPAEIDVEIVYREHFLSIQYSDIILSLDNTLQVLKVMDEVEEGYTVVGMPFNAFSTGKVIEVDAFYVLENIVSLVDLLKQTDLDVDNIITYEDNNIYINIQSLKVNFGDGEHIESRFNKFINIYQSLTTEDIRTGIIDVSSDGLPVYRPFGE